MSALTHFLIADQQQLASAFAGWLTVVDVPIERDVKNPFTGQTQRVKVWQPQSPLGNGAPAPNPNLDSLTHAPWKGVDHVKLATLGNIWSGSDVLEILAKPALLRPDDADMGLHEVPSWLTTALRSLSDDALQKLAESWQQTEEMQADQFTTDDCQNVLKSLRSLATKAGPEQRMYLFWSL